LKDDGISITRKYFAVSLLPMYLEKQDDARTTPVFRLYIPLLALNSGSGGRSRAHLKLQSSNFRTNFHKSRDPRDRGFFICEEM
jgi:hypothetical protein